MFSTISLAVLSAIALGSTVYGIYQKSKGKTNLEILDAIKVAAPDLIDQTTKTIAATKAIKK